MEKRGQRFLLIGVIFNSAFLILDRFTEYEAGWMDFVFGVLLGLALVFLISGLVLVFRAKKQAK